MTSLPAFAADLAAVSVMGIVPAATILTVEDCRRIIVCVMLGPLVRLLVHAIHYGDAVPLPIITVLGPSHFLQISAEHLSRVDNVLLLGNHTFFVKASMVIS